MIALHFAAFTLTPSNPVAAAVLQIIGLAALIWAGVLFMWASVPYRRTRSSPWMMAALMVTNTIYIALIATVPDSRWPMLVAAVALGVLPLTVAIAALPGFGHRLRWITVFLYIDLSIFLVAMQHHPGSGSTLALNAVLFAVYLGCGIHFWYAYQRPTAGAFITIAGFFFWAAVFVVAPILGIFFPHVQVESEVWNLPKYVVAVGMMLLLLEDQIEYAGYLALHDELTGLPNRRLFQDRLQGALERARRNGSRAALLLIDLDDFKQVNDTAGHHAGDQMLRHVGQTFLSKVRRSDTVARTGGDEFAVILEEPVNREIATRVAGALTEALLMPIEIESRPLRVGASVGVAVYPDDASNGETMCVAADCDMYAQKRGARRKEPQRHAEDAAALASDTMGERGLAPTR